MATVTKGYTFGATEQVTNTKLHTLADSATVTSIAQADLTASEGLVHVGSSAPSDTDQLWLDTNLTPYSLKFNDSSNWVPVAEYGALTNKSGQSLGQGRVVIVDTANDNAFKLTSTAADQKVLGVLIGTVANNALGVIASNGFGLTVLTEISASAGSFLRTSTATGKAEPVAFGSGVFAILTTSASGSGTAKLFGPVGVGVALADANSWSGAQTFSNMTLNGVTTMTTASAATTNWVPIVQVVNTITGASATGSTQLPSDDTIPQSTEGDQYMTLAITPKNSNNILKIDVVACLANGSTGAMTAALFQDSTANALAAAQRSIETANKSYNLSFIHYMTAGTTASTTFKVRAGLGAAGTTVLNGSSGARLLGGTLESSITITEIKQ